MLKPLKFNLLGPINVSWAGEPVMDLITGKTLALLSYLVVTARPHPRPALAGLLWGGMPEAKARTNLSKALSTLRRLLGDHLTITRQAVAFNQGSDFWLDVAAFEAKVNSPAIESLQAAVQLYQGDFLDGFYVRNAPEFETWVLGQRARLQEMVLQTLHQLSAHFADQGEAGWVTAIDYTTRLLRLEPWREEAHRQMMRLLALNGQRGAALAQYETCRKVLAEELGVEPGAETMTLYEKIRDGEVSVASKEVLSHLPSTVTPLSPNLSVSSQARFPSKLVGRTAEMKTLREVWQQASQGSGQMVLVEGEPGIGKTRLVQELLTELFGAATILRVKCPEMSDPLAYTLFVGPLRQALSEDILPDLSDPWLVELSRLLPEVQERNPSLAHPPQLDLATERRRLFDAIWATLLTLTNTKPLILFFDDLQWADASSLALLNHLSDQVTDAPVLIIGTFRSNEVGADHPLRRTQAVWQRLNRLSQLQLSALTMAGVAQLLQALTSWSGDDPSFCELLNRETQGNPLFVVETIASLRDEGRLPQSAEAWQWDFRADQLTIPFQVQTIIENRLNRLDDVTRQIITGAAVLRNSFDVEIVMAIAEISEPEISDGLETLLESGLLIEQGGDALTFSHDKIREVAYNSLSQLRRRRLHQRAAEGLEMIYRDRSESVADQLAYHFEQANLKDKAWSYHTLAGHRAKAQYAHETAVYHYQQAISLAPEGLTTTQIEQQLALYEGLGEILHALGCYTDAKAVYVKMRTTATQADNEIAQVRAWNMLGLTEWWLGDYQAALESQSQAEIMARTIGAPAQLALVKVLALKAWALIYLNDVEAASTEAEAAVSLGNSLDPLPLLALAESFFVLGRVHMGLRKYEQGVGHLQQALTYFRQVGQRRKGAEVWSVLAAIVGEVTGFEEGLMIAQEALSEAREIGHRQAEIFCLQNIAFANLQLDRYQAAEAILRQAITLAETSEAHYGLSVTYANLAEACLGQDRTAEAADLGQRALTLGQELKQPTGIAKAWRSLGLVSAQSGSPIIIKDQSYDATTCFAKSQQLFKEADDEINRARLLGDWATYELRQGNRSSGIAMWNEAKGIFEASGLIPEASQMADLPHLPSAPHNLPAQSTPFIGREREMAALNHLIANPDVRLLTILGPGGMGKTRLALEMGATQLARFGQGVYFVPLAPIDEIRDIVPAIAEVLDFSFYEGGTQQQQLLDYLQEKEMLLILDNVEHLLDATESGEGASQIITTMLRTAPRVKVITTSRERLKLQEEQLFPISGIDFPTLESVDNASEYSAVRLFVQSTRRVVPDFELTDEEMADVVHICHMVQGMPLAILLAAAWIELLSAQEIAAKISHSLDFLETDLRNIPARQRSMRAVFDHSWKLLTEQEQAMLQQISIFRGGFTKAAAQAVTGASLRNLMALVNKSLIYRAGEDRYDIHELLRQYAAEKLAEQDVEVAVRDRHCTYYCDFLHHREADLKGPRHQVALTEIERELENVKTAWNWAAQQGQLKQLDQAIFSLVDFYHWRIRWQEGEELCHLAAKKLASVTSVDGIRVRAKALTDQGHFNLVLGRADVARHLLRRGLSLLDDLADEGQDVRPERAYALWIMGDIEWDKNEKAKELLTKSLTLNENLGNEWLTAQLLRELGNVAVPSGDYDQAQKLCRKSLAICQSLGYQQGIASALVALAHIALPQGQFEDAAKLARELLLIDREYGDRGSLARGFLYAGRILTWAGEFAEGYAMLEGCLPIYGNQGARSTIALVRAWLGHGQCHLGEYDQARTQIEQSLTLFEETGEDERIALWFLGQALLALEEYAEAQNVLQESATRFRETGQRSELGLVLGTLGHVWHKLGDLSQAQQHLAEALRIGIEIRAFSPVQAALPVISLILADRGEKEQAVELYALVSCYPPVANSRWFYDTCERHLAAATVNLPSGVGAAAQERGRLRDVWQAVEELLADSNLEAV